MKRFYLGIIMLLFVVTAVAQVQTINLHGFAVGSSIAGNGNTTSSIIGEPFTGITMNNGYEMTKGLAQAQLEVMELEATVDYGVGYNENGFSYPATTPVGVYTANLYAPLGGSYHYDLLKKLTLTVEPNIYCGFIELPYTESFEDYTTSTTTVTGVEPRCWEVVSEDVALTDATKPQLYRGYATTGSYSLRLKNRCVYAMPELDEGINVSALTMTFNLRQPNAIYRLQVGVVDAQGNFTSVKTINNASTETEEVSVDFANYTGSGHRIAFRNTLVSGSTVDYSINYIDDITLTEVCEAITLPYSERFENYTGSTTAATGVEPKCWELVQEDVAMTDATRPQLYYKSEFAHSGSYSLKLNNRGIYAMPEMSDYISMREVKLEMYLRQPKAVYQLEVGVWEDNGTFVPVKRFNNSTTELEFVECDFTSYMGNGGRIAFRNVLGGNSSIASSVNYLDDIRLTNVCWEGIVLPYTETFESQTTSTTAATGVEPICWELVQEDVAMPNAKRPQIYYKSDYAHSGSYSLKLSNRGVYAMPYLSWDMDEITLDRIKLEMYVRQPNAAYQLEVGAWDDEEEVFIPIHRINNSTTGVEKVTLDFSCYDGWASRIAFRNVLADGYNYDYSYNYIDDITLTELPYEECGISELPYTENFDSYTTVTTAETGMRPRCWWVVRADVELTDATRPQLYYNTTYATSGSYTLRMKNRCIYAMPYLDEDINVSDLTMTLKLRQPKAVYRLQVGVLDEQFNFEVVKTINNASTETEDVTVDFSGYTGRGHCIAFRNTLSSSSTLDYSVNYIDDITLDYAPASCGISELPYTENFDAFTASTTAETGVQPRCWEVINEDVALTNSTKPQVYYNSTYASSGSYSLRMKNRCVYAMPELDADVNVNELIMTLKLRQPKTTYRLQVGVVDAQGNFTSVKTINNASTETEEVTVSFADYNGYGNRIAFRNTLPSSSTLDYSINYLDDITLDYAPASCGISELPYTEDFDSYTTMTTAETGVRPTCWEVVTEDVTLTDATKPQVYYNSTYATSGSYTLRMKNRCVFAMPELGEDINVSDLTMTFKLRQPKTTYRLQVGVVDGQGNFTSVKTINNASTETEEVTVSFADYNGYGNRIAFRNTLPSSSTLDYSVNYIDDITLDYTPADCGISELPYSENFDDYTAMTTAETGVQPRCWEVVQEDVALTDATKPQVYYNTTYATSGSYTLRMKNRCVYAMPRLDSEPNNISEVLTMTLNVRQSNSLYRLQVGVWDESAQEFMPIQTIKCTSTEMQGFTVQIPYEILANGNRIAFRNTLGSGSTLDYSVNYIDDINFDFNSNAVKEKMDEDVNGAMNAGRDLVDIVVYPNPTKDFVNVQCTMNNVQSVEVIDVYGKVVNTLNVTDNQTRINVSGLAAGMYFVRVATDKGAVTKPFVKK